MPQTPDSEARLVRQHAILNDVVALITRREPLEHWSADLRRVLLLALAEQGVTTAEAWKVTALRRHLFGASEPPQIARWLIGAAAPSDDERAAAERLRADLPAHVKLRSAATLLG